MSSVLNPDLNSKLASGLSPIPDDSAASRFDLAKMDPGGLPAAIAAWLFDDPQWWMKLLREYWPAPQLKGKGLLTRYDHVQEALKKESIFQVPFGPRMTQMTGSANFILGQQDGPDYQRSRAQIMQAFQRSDVANIVAPHCTAWARDIVAAAPGRIDAIEALITRVPTLVVQHYYGVPINDLKAFAQWTIAMSGYMFGPPGPRPASADMADIAAACTRPVIYHAIRQTRAMQPRPDTIVARMLALQESDSPLAAGMTDDVMLGHLYGMITGFVPTNTIAAGNLLEALLRRPAVLARCCELARADDDTALEAALFEAMRYMPINPGPFRTCVQDAVLAQGKPDEVRIKGGTTLMVSTQSAMFDERRVNDPQAFKPGQRPAGDYMLFGHGLHECIGAFLARAQITQTMKPLLKRKNLRRASGPAGQMQRVLVFPVHLFVEFDPD